MVAKHTRLSEASGPDNYDPPPYVLTTKNLIINSAKDNRDAIALISFSEDYSALEGLDLSKVKAHTNGYANGHTNGHTNGQVAPKDAAYLRLTYSELYLAAQRLATSLQAKGIKKGDAICTVMYTGIEVITVFWASCLLGCVWAPLHPRTASNAKELNHDLGLAEPAAIVALNGEVAGQIDQDSIGSRVKVKLVASGSSAKGWSTWKELISDKAPLVEIKEDTDRFCEDESTLIVYTSGTTSMPKGCGHTNRTFGESALKGQRLFEFTQRTVLHHNFPFHHIGGSFPSFATWIGGGTVLIPAALFSAEMAVKAMRAEPVTDFAVLPSHMLAMQEYDPTPYNHGRDRLLVAMSATTILREHYISAKEYFNFTHFTAPYGASEGVPVTGEIYAAATFNPAPGPINPGPPCPTVRVKVCEQGGKDPIPRNEIGELHQSGAQVIPGYLKKKVDEFYTDEDGVWWYVTGDAAMMDDYDKVDIIGRVKDMIIRGGVNISAARIEDVINELPGVEGYVIAMTDLYSGEVPAAIVRYYSDSRKQATSVQIRESVLKELGPTFALAEVISIEELGLSDWPKTTSGKVRKVDLRAALNKYIGDKSEQDQSSGDSSMQGMLTELWSKILGLPASRLSPETDLRDLADSLTTMQFRSQLRKKLGKSLSTQQLLNTYTIAAQAKVLEAQQSAPTARPTMNIKREGPPGIDDVSFVDGDEARFEQIKRNVSSQLMKLGLVWRTDVEDLIPFWDFGKFASRKYRPKSMTHRHAFVSENLSKATIREMWEKVMTYHPLIRSIGCQEGNGDDRYVVTLRPSKTFFDHCFYDGGQVEKASDLAQLCLHEPQGNTFVPGILYKFILADVKETNSSAFIFVGQHSIFDAGSMTLFFENFNRILNGSSLVEYPNYKPWADMYHNNRLSSKATQAVKARARQLKGISNLKKALWPPSKAPGFYLGDDWEAVDPKTMQPANLSLRPTVEPDQNVATGLSERGLAAPYNQGVTRAFEIPKLFNLQQAHGIHPVTLVQNALALSNMYMTRQPAALLSLANGGRVWPFLAPEVAELLPEPAEIDGPMLEFVTHVIQLPQNQQISVIDFLKGQQKEQQTLSKYVHAPLFRIQEELGPVDGPMVEEIIRHQVFNWLPIVGKGGVPLKGFRNVQKTHHNDFRITWAAGMATDETVVVHADQDRAQITVEELQRAQEIMQHAALWMCNEQNWNRNVAEFLNEKI